MIFKGVTIDGQQFDIGDPVSLEINMAYNTPADSVYACFCFTNEISEIKNILIFDNENIIFDGIVDEQIFEVSSTGAFLKIYARSTAALLIDNEALPQTYNNVSLKTIFQRHIEPYGFTNYIGDDTKFCDTFVVYKGMSEWEVLEKFCDTYLDLKPIIKKDKTIYISNMISDNKNIILDNLGDIKYKTIEINNFRYNKISEVYIKTVKEDNYITKVTNENAIDNGIIRKRYLDISDSFKDPVNFANNYIVNNNIKSYEVLAKCIGFININIGSKVFINDNKFKYLKNLVVSKVKYKLDSLGETTDITMYKGD